MKITSVSNPQWANENKTLINCQITIEEFGNKLLPFTASIHDCEAHGQNLFSELVKDIYGPIAEYEPPTTSQLEAEARQKRDELLVELDTIIANPLRWNSMTEEQQDAYALYRLELLDVPQQDGFPTDIVWPTKP